MAGKHLVDDAAERVDVSRDADVIATGRLLGTHVLRRPERNSVLCQRLAGFVCGDMSDSEIGEKRVPVGEENVFRLHVPMHEAVAVCVIEAVADFSRDADRFVEDQLLFALHQVSKRSTGHKWCDVILEALCLARIDQRNDVRMRQARCDSNLAKETLGSDRNADVLPQNLDRDLTLMLALFGEVNYRHAPAPEDALYRVAVAESAGEAVRHEGRIYSQPVWRAPSTLLDHHVLLEPRDFRLVHVLPDFAAELLDGCVRAILLELVTHSRSNARNE